MTSNSGTYEFGAGEQLCAYVYGSDGAFKSKSAGSGSVTLALGAGEVGVVVRGDACAS